MKPEIRQFIVDALRFHAGALREDPTWTKPYTPEELEAAADAIESQRLRRLADRLRRLADHDAWQEGENEWTEATTSTMQEAADKLEASL